MGSEGATKSSMGSLYHPPRFHRWAREETPSVIGLVGSSGEKGKEAKTITKSKLSGDTGVHTLGKKMAKGGGGVGHAVVREGAKRGEEKKVVGGRVTGQGEGKKGLKRRGVKKPLPLKGPRARKVELGEQSEDGV